MLHKELNRLYINGQYQEYLDLFSENMLDCFNMDFTTICRYAGSLIQLHRYKEGYEALNKLEGYCRKDEDKIELAFNYYYCGKCEDALRILSDVKLLSPRRFYLLAKIYLFKGEIYEAKQYIKYIFHYYPDSEYAKKCYYLMKAIKNNAFKGSFIEIGYDYFTKSGKKIEPGHIIYIKSAEQLECKYIGKDAKDYKRPYLVWRVEGNKLYVSPITHVYNRYRYALFLQDYPNSRYERYVINSYCTTTTDNIYSVCDKLKDNELDRVFEFIHSGLYFNEGVEEADKKEFYDLVNGEASVGDIIVFADDFKTRCTKTFYIAGELDNEFLGYFLNPITFEVKDDTLCKVNKDIVVKRRLKKQDDGSVIMLRKRADEKLVK